MAKKRAARREAAREAARLARDLDRLAKLERGGTPITPFRIVSPSEVEVHVVDAKCPICKGEFDLKEHAAETISGRRLRIAKAICRACGTPRSIYFELESTTLN